MTTQIIPGSLQAIALSSGASIAETFVSADAIVIVDTSSSMTAVDGSEYEMPVFGEPLRRRAAGPTRYDRACTELASLQQTLPGKIAVISFSDDTEFCPAGVPTFLHGSTDMAAALRFVHVADDTGVRFILISDGEPNDEEKTLAAARRFKSTIDTIFIGAAGGRGEAFLQRLSQSTGGRHIQTEQVKELADNVQRLLAVAS